MRFKIPVSDRTKLAVAVSHGVADLGLPSSDLALYALAAVPVPGSVSTALFVASSVAHFATDITLLGSTLLHAAVLATIRRRGYASAARVVLNYMVCVHVPLLVCRLILANAAAELAWLAAASVLSVACRDNLLRDGCFVFGESLQRLVVVHVFLNRPF